MRSHRFSFMQLQEGSCHLNCHVPLSPFNQVISFYLNSIKEMLMTQADRFSQEEVRNFIQNRNPAQLLFSTKSLPLLKCMNLAEIQPERRLMPALAIRNNSKHLFWRAPWLNQSHTDSLESHPSASVAYLVLLLPMEGSWAVDLLESKWIWVGTVFWFPFLWVGLKSEMRYWLGGLCETEHGFCWLGGVEGNFIFRRGDGVELDCGQNRLDWTFIHQGLPGSQGELFSTGTCGILAGLY